MKTTTSNLVTYLMRVDARSPQLRVSKMLSVASKLGDPKQVKAFNLPLESTCCSDDPSDTIASSVCRARCYYAKMVEGRDTVAERARLNFQLAQRTDFQLLLAGAIIKAGVQLIRLQDFGDFYGAEYVKKIAGVAKTCSDVRFLAYTRAWRRSELVEALKKFAALPNVNLLLSADSETGIPPPIPNTKVAWLADHDGAEPPVPVHVVFRASHEKTPDGYRTPCTKLNGSTVCLHEDGRYSATKKTRNSSGRERKAKIGPPDCVTCGFCMFKTGAATRPRAMA